MHPQNSAINNIQAWHYYAIQYIFTHVSNLMKQEKFGKELEYVNESKAAFT